MTRTVYVNGKYLPENEATVSIFDRGFLFADGVYEVTSVLDGKLIDFDGHARRLARSLGELGMRNPIATEDLLEVHRELVRANGIVEGLIYLQITAARLLIAILPIPVKTRRRPSCCSHKINQVLRTARWRRQALR